MAWPTDDLQYDSPGTDPAREGFSAGARKPWRQGIYNLVAKVKAILAQRGVPGGLASLDDTGRLPSDELTVHTHGATTPSAHVHNQYLLGSARGARNGVASLDNAGKVPEQQLNSAWLLGWNGNGPRLPARSNGAWTNICRANYGDALLILVGYSWGAARPMATMLYQCGGANWYYQLPAGDDSTPDSLQIGLRYSGGYVQGAQNWPTTRDAQVRVVAVRRLA